MKAIAIISQDAKNKSISWHFDKVMSAIAYDMDLTVVFLHEGYSQWVDTKIWRCLEIYGVEKIYKVDKSLSKKSSSGNAPVDISLNKLKKLIHEADVIL